MRWDVFRTRGCASPILGYVKDKVPQLSNNERDFLRIAAIASGFGFGCVVASLYSLRQSPDGLTFQISLGTFVAFAVGAACGWGYWRALAKVVAAAQDRGTPIAERGRTKLMIWTAGAWLLGLSAFLYPIRFVNRDNLRDVLEGLGFAFAVLSLVALVLWRIKRYLEEDAKRS